jgi:hypothetical protein
MTPARRLSGTNRFTDPALYWTAFMDDILVHCPICDGLAHQVPKPAVDTEWAALLPKHRRSAERRVVCDRCGVVGARSGGTARRGSTTPTDPRARSSYSGLPLWLQTRCCGHTLWAYHQDHPDLLRSWIGADLRERGSTPPTPATGWGRWETETLVERLPEWMKVAKNREQVLAAIETLSG